MAEQMTPCIPCKLGACHRCIAEQACGCRERDHNGFNEEEPLLGLATTRTLLTELATRMEITQNSTKGRDLGRLCREAIDNLDAGVLDYRPVN